MQQTVVQNVQQNLVFDGTQDVWVNQEQYESIRLRSFLCCVKLETGGQFIAWFCIIVNSLLFFVGISNYFPKGFNIQSEHFYIYGFKKDGMDILSMIMCSIFILTSVVCSRGIKKRDHDQVKSLMVFSGLASILSLAQICITFSKLSVILGIIFCIVFGYFFMVLFSLYDIFSLEHKIIKLAQYI